MPNPIHPPADRIKVQYQSNKFSPERVQERVVRMEDPNGTIAVFDLSDMATIRQYLIPSTMLPPEVAALAAMRMGMQHAATDWPLVPMEDFQLA